jgi:hypothetical protein
VLSTLTVHPYCFAHINIARKIWLSRYKVAHTRPKRDIIAPILLQQGSVLNMIWSWALTTFAPDTLEQQLQYDTQCLAQEPLAWFQSWLLHSWQTINEVSSPSSAFALLS